MVTLVLRCMPETERMRAEYDVAVYLVTDDSPCAYTSFHQTKLGALTQAIELVSANSEWEWDGNVGVSQC
jgi:hypothetical protein